MLEAIRGWFRAQGFLEVNTPVLLDAPSYNSHVQEFETRFGKRRLWLRTSPEVFHKRLLAEGLTRIFEIGPFFREGFGEQGQLHNPEFTGLEFYETGHDYHRIMERTEQMVCAAIQAVAGKTLIGGVEVRPPWERLTVREAFRRHAGIDLDAAHTLAALAAAATAAGIRVAADDGYDDVFFRILLERVEGKLGFSRPCFLYDYPASMAAMARRKPTEPGWAERVEVYLAGIELANGFTELSDATEQRMRFQEERALRAAHDGVPDDSLPLDEAFLAALPAMPLSTGIAIGLDRVLMLAMEKSSLAEVLAFPFGP